MQNEAYSVGLISLGFKRRACIDADPALVVAFHFGLAVVPEVPRLVEVFPRVDSKQTRNCSN